MHTEMKANYIEIASNVLDGIKFHLTTWIFYEWLATLIAENCTELCTY